MYKKESLMRMNTGGVVPRTNLVSCIPLYHTDQPFLFLTLTLEQRHMHGAHLRHQNEETHMNKKNPIRRDS